MSKARILVLLLVVSVPWLACAAAPPPEPVTSNATDPPAREETAAVVEPDSAVTAGGRAPEVPAIEDLVSESEIIYNDAVVEYEQGNPAVSDSLFRKALDRLTDAKILSTKYPATYDAFKQVMDEMYARLNESLQQLDVPREDILTASPKELEETGLDSLSLPEHHNGFEMPIDPSQPLIQKYLHLFQKGKRRSFLEESFRRSGRYRDMVLREIRARGLPEELWLVAMIESGYKTSAYSRKRAAGLWQFIPSTARNYGLVINEWLDERRDPVKSTRAALTYLQELYRRFNSWDWAIAAYNRGEANIHNDIRNSHIVEFYEAAEAGATHPQTRDHVPQIHAAAIIARDPAAYGFDLEFDSPLQVDTLRIDYVVDLGVVAKVLGVDEKEIKELNPELRTWVTPLLSKDYPNYLLKLPAGTRETYRSRIAEVEDLTPERRIRYIVKRGDTLGAIARRFGVRWRQIKRWNNIRGSRIYPGQSLVIRPDHDYHGESLASPPATGAAKVHVVRRGDTLSEIARRYRVRVSDLRRWNGLGGRRFIYPGQRLKVYPPA